MATFPHSPPSITGQIQTVHRFLQNSPLVERELAEAFNDTAISRILRGSLVTQSGSVIVSRDADLLADDVPVEIAPGAEYRRVTVGDGDAKVYSTVKIGLEHLITDESIRREQRAVVERAKVRLANSVNLEIAERGLAAVVAEVVATEAGTDWESATSGTAILRPIAKAKAKLTNLRKGFVSDIFVITETAAAILASDDNIAKLLQRDGNAPVYSGYIGTLLNLEVIAVPDSSLPASVRDDGLVADSRFLGGIADEVPFTGKSIRKEEIDAYLLQAKRECVPFIANPDAGVWVTDILG